MAKKIIITVIAVIVLLAAGSVGTYQLYIKPKYAEQLINTADKILQDEEVKKIIESDKIQTILESENVKHLLESSEAQEILDSQQNSQSDETETADDNSKISAKDMADGMKIASKLDVDKVKQLAGSDVSSEEKKEIMKYVKDTLSDEEIAKMVVLVAKYKESLKQ